MFIPIRYNVRHLADRWTSTLSTVLIFGLVVGVFVVVMSLALGLDRAFVSTGDPMNLLVMTPGVNTELASAVGGIRTYEFVRSLAGIEKDDDGVPLVSPEIVMQVNKPKRSDGERVNLQIRALNLQGVKIRRKVRIVEGRMFEPGMREIIVSKRVAARFQDYGLGEQPHMGKGVWTVVGVFDAAGTAYDSEVWCDYQEWMQEFNRSYLNIIALRAEDAVAVESLARLVPERISWLSAKSEAAYYESQTKASKPLKAFGVSLAVVMSIGACFAGMNAMYASVANRSKEIGTLRVLGFKPASIVVCFLIESVLIALIGGALGCLAAYPMNWVTTGTANQQTSAEVIFRLAVTPGLMGVGLAFAVVMGIVGGLLPAISAARRPISEAMARH